MDPNPVVPVPGHCPSDLGVVEADDRDLTDLRYAILRHTRDALADINDLVCAVERSGPRILVHLAGPAITPARQRALSVRVLDAVRSIGRTYGQVDVTYQATPDTRAAGQEPT
jgi:hypothetical protein